MSGKHNRTTSTLQKGLKNAVNEMDSSNAFRAAFSTHLPNSKTSSPFKVDGLLEDEFSDVRSLLEFKYNLDLRNKVEQSGVLIQALFYIKRFEREGKKLPTTIFVGDKNECFCMSVKVLEKYFNKPIDWTTSPSSAKDKHPGMLQALVDDQDILPFVFDVNSKMFNFGEVVDLITALGKGVTLRVKITKDNVVEIFRDWRDKVLTDEDVKNPPTMGKDAAETGAIIQAATIKQANIFFACLTDRENTYPKPTKKNCLISRGEDVKINEREHKIFFARFSQILSPSELDVLVANKDRIIEEVSRRRTGAFFTPTLWVAEAHRMLDESLGANWKEEYVVWDCASGTNNLTRDARFKELYCSTLDQGDVNTVKDMGYNKGSTVFQYDFLNDDAVDELGPKVPAGLKKAFADGKKVLFLINPPYGTAKSGGSQEGNSKTGVAKNKTNEAMLREKMGFAARQLYCQFLYRIERLQRKYKGISIGVFAPPNFLTSGSNRAFRSCFFEGFKFQTGMMFQASNFADVTGDWAISFTIWNNGKTKSSTFQFVPKEINFDTFMIKPISIKNIYSTDSTASEWVRSDIQNFPMEVALNLSSAVKVINGDKKLVSGFIGCMNNNSNDVHQSATTVFLLSTASGYNANVSVVPANIRKVTALFCARRSVVPTWLNWQDEYLVPHAADPASPLNARYEQWVNDALVYALFNSKSNQSSLRDVQYKGKTWQIKNHFFFMSAKEMQALADKSGFQEMYQDARAYGDDSFVFKQLASTTLSDDAKAVLEAARSLVRTSMAMRKNWHYDHPEHHLQAWDQGWAAMKPMFKACHKGLYDQFVTTYKSFERRMQKGVYEYGFLR